jgi:hypothetical protein
LWWLLYLREVVAVGGLEHCVVGCLSSFQRLTILVVVAGATQVVAVVVVEAEKLLLLLSPWIHGAQRGLFSTVRKLYVPSWTTPTSRGHYRVRRPLNEPS